LDREDIASCEMQVEDGRFFLVRTSPVLGSEGEYLGAVVIFVDISAIKRLDLLKSEFVAKVSHELRSPLSTIHEQMAMVLQDMLEQEQSDRDHRILARAQEKTRGLISLIEDLLDLSRLEAGVAYQDWQPVQVEELLSRLVEFSKSRAEDKKQRLKLDLPEEPLPAVKADPKALESVFDNLISNAIKYTPEEGEVAVRVHSDHGQISVEVQDTGFGIDPKEQERIFERFYRVKNERTRSITGTGLGLAIVKGILDDLGGRITLSSEPGRGSCFTVLLPAQPRD
jgi:signal transduction histidine kinase